MFQRNYRIEDATCMNVDDRSRDKHTTMFYRIL